MADKRRSGRSGFLKRALVFLLAMLLGMALFAGALVGAVYAGLSLVTLDKLEDAGVSVGDGVLTEESILRQLSVLGLIDEISTISRNLDGVTVNSLIEDYGVIVSEDILGNIPKELLDLPLSEYSGDRILSVFLENTTVGQILPLIGDGILPEPALAKVEDRTIDLLVEGDLAALFEGVYLGDFVGISLADDGEGGVEPVIPDGETASLISYLGTVSLGDYFAAEDGNTVIQATLDRTPMSVLLGEGDGNLLYDALSGKNLGDILSMEDGGFRFETDAILSDLYLGDVLGYTLSDDGIWRDGENAPAKGLYAELVKLKIDGLDGDKILEAMDNVYVAEMMDYEKEKTGEENGKPIYRFYRYENGTEVEMEGVIAEFGALTIGELRDEDCLDRELRELKIGVAMGYEEVDGVWRDAETKEEASGVLRVFLDTTVENMGDRINDMYLGEIMGFDNIAAEGETPVFRKNGTEAPSALMATFVDMRLEDIDQDTVFTDRIKTVRLGYALGYFYKTSDPAVDPNTFTTPEQFSENGKWYTDADCTAGNEVKGIFRTLSGYCVEGMDGAVKTLHVSDALGYELVDGKWQDDEGNEPSGVLRVLMGSTLDSLSADTGKVYVGEIMGYEKYDITTGEAFVEGVSSEDNLGFRKKTSTNAYEEATGIIAEFVTMQVSELEQEDTLTQKINGMKIGTAMSYTCDGGIWRDKLGTAVENPLLLSVIDKTVGEMGGALDDMTLADAMGYKKDSDGKWLKSDGTPEDNNFILAILDKKVTEMESTMDTITLAEAMGYKKDSDGKWHKPDGTVEKNAFILAILDKKVTEIESTMDTITLADAMGYTKNKDGKWLKSDGTPEENTFILAILDKKVSEMESAMDTMLLGDVMGYTFIPHKNADPTKPDYYENGGTWYATYVAENSEDNVLVSGYVKILGPATKIGELNKKLENLDKVTVGELKAAGVLNITPNQEDTLDGIFAMDPEMAGKDWRELPIDEFINQLIPG